MGDAYCYPPFRVWQVTKDTIVRDVSKFARTSRVLWYGDQPVHV